MKVLLLGEFSSLHCNLAHGLKKLGIDVTTASNGDFWKNIPRDIDIKQPKKFKKLIFPINLIKNFPKLTGYDIVQLVEPNFLMSSPSLSYLYFELLRHGNKNFFMSASGMNYHYIKYALTGQLKHSVFYIPEVQNDPFTINARQLTDYKIFKNLNIRISEYCKGIIATANGYYDAYEHYYPEKTKYIPLPIDTEKYPYVNTITSETKKVNFFLGLMNKRVKFKGTDKIHKALLQLKKKYPNDVELTIIDTVPFNKYIELINEAHVLCDQLYSYSYGMNGLIGLSKGLIVAGGADIEMYKTLKEYNNRPVINLNNDHNNILGALELLLENKSNLKEHSLQSREFAIKHHDSVKVAQQYLDFWKSKIS